MDLEPNEQLNEAELYIKRQQEYIKTLEEDGSKILENNDKLRKSIKEKEKQIDHYEKVLNKISSTTMAMGYLTVTELANDLKRIARNATKE